MVKFKEPKDEKISKKRTADAAPFMNLSGAHKDWYHPNSMGKMRKEPNYKRREIKK